MPTWHPTVKLISVMILVFPTRVTVFISQNDFLTNFWHVLRLSIFAKSDDIKKLNTIDKINLLLYNCIAHFGEITLKADVFVPESGVRVVGQIVGHPEQAIQPSQMVNQNTFFVAPCPVVI